MPILQRRVHFWLGGLIGLAGLRALRATWHLDLLDPAGVVPHLRDGDAQGVVAFWHRQMLSVLVLTERWPACMAVSTHPHGEFLAHALERLGIRTARGSSTEHGRNALNGMLDHAAAGLSILIAPDGPKGPRLVAKPGVGIVAQRAGLPVYPIGVAVRDAWIMKGWDRFVIPRPWTQTVVLFGPALHIGTSESVDAFCERVSKAMQEATRNAEEHLDRTP